MQQDLPHGNLKPTDLDPHIRIHFGIPSTASILAIDPIQQLLAVGTLDGRIKVIGGYNIEALLISPREMPYKNLEEPQDHYIGPDTLGNHALDGSLNLDVFAECDRFVGDEHGMVSVVQYGTEDEKLVNMPYHISPVYISEKTGISFPNDQSVVGVLPQPSSSGNRQVIPQLRENPYREIVFWTFSYGGQDFVKDLYGAVLILPHPCVYPLSSSEVPYNLCKNNNERLLIAYQYGLFVLWDVLESKVIVLKGDNDLRIKDHLSESPSNLAVDPLEDAHEHMNEKEISALCWASSVGSMLAVGYIDGDILLWNIPRGSFLKSKSAGVSCDDVVKLQLSSAEKRLPVIFLCWGESSISQSSCGGQLFVYGGCEIGSEEVITVVSLQWSLGMEMLKSVRRVDFSLIGAFADMVTSSSLETTVKSNFDGLFVLTRPGKLQFYCMENLSALLSQSEKKSSVSGTESPVVIPISDPLMTVAKMSLQPSDGNLAKWLSEMATVSSNVAEGSKWPLTGGLQREITSDEEDAQKIIYIIGYQDGSVRIWDATTPIFPLVSVIEGQVHGVANASSNVSVTKIDFCASMMNLAVGTHCGEVRVYSLNNEAGATKLHWINHSERIVYDVPLQKGPQCRAVFSLVNSSVQALHFSASGAKLAVGFESSHVAALDMISLSVLFSTDSVANSSFPVISFISKEFSDAHGYSRGPKHLGTKNMEQPGEELFTVTEDAKISVVDCQTGSPISSRPLHLKEHTAVKGSCFMSASSSEHHDQSNKETNIVDESKQDTSSKRGDLKDTGAGHLSMHGERLLDSLLLLCCENTLRLYYTKSILQGEDKPISKVKLAKPCSWTSIFKKDDKVVGLILVYQSGDLEVRSFPDLELLTESSLISILRWNMRPNMKLASCTDHGLICLANGSELAFLSLSTSEFETRFLEFLPLLHDKVVAAAADAAISISMKQKKQAPPTGIIGDIVKGFKKEKPNNAKDNPPGNLYKLQEAFSRPVVPDSSINTVEEKEEEELDIDDIEIDEPVMESSTSSHQAKEKTTKAEKDRLFEGASVNLKPRTRTPEEIMAAYKGTEYASAAAERARNKLLERQEKLERINQRSEDLRYEAENFASMANELVKTMEICGLQEDIWTDEAICGLQEDTWKDETANSEP
uniref:V-SNARE coiled-coil homology domain-containing protein n=1 Tax=Chenopodium quinoa TaxID=63459 RepID=A0A803MK69_CHEQI